MVSNRRVNDQTANIGKRVFTHLLKRTRSGAAAVEFAVCLPFILAIVFGSIETANAVYLQNSLTAAAYEGGAVAAAVGGSSDIATDRANAVLTLLGVYSATVTVTPNVDTNTATGTTIVVTVTAPLNANTATGWRLGNLVQTATYTINHL